MSWVLREVEKPIDPHLRAPDYGDSEEFTIRMHHGGKFLGQRVYLGGEVSHFDHCHSDYMSLQEIDSMSIKLGHHKDGDKVAQRFHFTVGHCDDPTNLRELLCDNDAMHLDNFVDNDRVVGIFVEHLDLKKNDLSDNGEKDVDSSNGENAGKASRVDNDGEASKGENDGQCSILNEDNNIYKNNEVEGLNANIAIDDHRQGHEEDEKNAKNVTGGLADSDYSFDDDILFYDNIDNDIEWVGFNLGVPTVGMTTHPNEIRGEKCVCNPAYKNLFNLTVDMDKPEFKVGQCFSFIDIFRAAMRKHSMLHGRDIVFVKNDPNKARVKCKDSKYKWLMYASYMHGEKTIQVKTLNKKHRDNSIKPPVL
ncbi:hypothetical protein CDL12_30196 [Handroanthus impetiginosus]|uniref:Uncharacterized protein n=1 Tax=Handroanthus impetiginosus TaxID=429701 RepID=A0A2G9FWR7_9LAMI|nr:hypothetical protein CDL12_30196 [Handroanthus impetiginosus]